MRPRLLLVSIPLGLLALTACRPGPEGPPNYPDYGTFVDPGDPRLPGPFPYVEGDNRTSVAG
jgi:hypothetical protein